MKARLAILALGVVLVVPGMFARGYWDPDEGRYGAVAREVWRGDGAVVPHLAGEEYHEKPPLYFWLVAGCQMLAGDTHAWASRIPGAVATILTALLLLGLVTRTHGRKEGVTAAAIFLTSWLVLQMSGWVGIDAVAMFLVTACLVLQDRALEGGRGGVLLAAGTYALLAAIVLAKGAPVVIALFALAGTAWLYRGPRGLFRGHLIWGIPLFLILLAAWAIPAAKASAEGWGYLRGLTLGQAGRRLVDSSSHAAPIHYYLVRFPLFFLPWAVLLPAMVMTVRSAWQAGGDRRAAMGRYLLWFVVPLVVFSLVSGKRERYILPLFVPAAAIAGIAVVRMAGSRWFTPFVRRPLVGVLALLGVAGIALAVAPFLFEPYLLPKIRGSLSSNPLAAQWQANEIAERVLASRWILVACSLSAVFVVAEGLFARRGEAPVQPVCGAVAFLVLGLATVGLPAFDRVKSYEPLVVEARSMTRARLPEFAVGGLQPGPFCLALDTDRLEVIPREGMREAILALLEREPRTVIFADENDFARVRERRARVFRLTERKVGRRHLVAFTGSAD